MFDGRMLTRAAWRSFALAAVCSAWLAAPAAAAEIVQVRVGNHPTFTRVVFELDAPAGYRIERRTAEGEDTEEILVTVEAGSTPRSVNSSSVMVERVAVQDGRERVAAHIRLKQSPSRVKEMILAQPPRLVFDLVFPEAELAKIRAAEQRRAQAAAPAASAQPPKTPEAKPAASAQPPKTPEAKPAASAQPPKTPEAKPAEALTRLPTQPEPRAQAQLAPEAAKRPERATGAPQAALPSEAAHKPPTPLEEPAPQQLARKPAEPDGSPPPAPTASSPEGMAAAEKPARTQPDAATSAPAEAKRPERMAQAPRPKPRVQPPPATPAGAQPESAWSGIGDLPVRWLAAAAAAIVIVILMVIWLRRRSLPNDLDVTALVEAAEAEPDQDFELGGESLERSEPDAGASFLARTTPQNPPAPREVGGPDIQAGPGRFDDVDSEKENEMDMESPELSRSETQTRVGAGTAAGGADVLRLVRELERRVAQLETRLDESTDARERLERQVAAQAEELRVQRAAIARTQRALRSMNRGEEEQATEPALREPIK